ncbi:two-component system WalR/WalK regulatory protein YycH [Pullulanibacillus camelliae]|uniref:Two-component system WalR/WalK regulatory protein YycH n=2 Tax=Pullulanibacillus camelliae TaxID=1707096 RepID=A0A8J3E1D2_9BACL|nr:two-component system WalR/WalK regulatory protein YycH [Pullulanibacillus camelliae]
MRELIKTILLTVLVLLSFFLTWNIWTFQGDFEEVEPQVTNNQVSIDMGYNLNEIVKPYQFLIQDQNVVYGTVDRVEVDKMFDALLNAKWTVPVSNSINDKDLPSREYDLLFPAPITSEIIKSLFSFTKDNTNIPATAVNRMALYVDDAHGKEHANTTLVFKDQTGKNIFYATSKNFNISKINSLSGSWADLGEDWVPYTRVMVRGNKEVFLPTHSTQLDQKKFLYEPVQIEKFERILFPDLGSVQEHNGVYSDGVNTLSQDQDVLTFSSGSGSQNISQDMDTIYDSWMKINSYQGWTDKYIYDSYTSKPASGESEVGFRIMVDDLPVYSLSNKYQAMIHLKWNKGQLLEQDRTLINLNTVAFSESHGKKLQSAQEVLQTLQNDKISLKDVQDIRMGYIMVQDTEAQIVTMTPAWLYEKNDEWHQLFTDSDLAAQVKQNEVQNMGGNDQ